jgi:hypothetical protein
MKATLLGFTALLATAQLTSASAVTLDFDSLPSMDYHAGAPIPVAAQLSTQYLDTYGVSFTSGSPYVAVVELFPGHATSGSNGIGNSTPGGILTYDRQYPIIATFFNPAHPHSPGVTDFVSLRGDLNGTPQYLVTLNAYGVNHMLIASVTTADVGGETLSIAAPGIHLVEFLGTPDDVGGVAVDDFTFNTVTSVGQGVPEPSTLAMLLLGFVSLGFAVERGKFRQTRSSTSLAGHKLAPLRRSGASEDSGMFRRVGLAEAR